MLLKIGPIFEVLSIVLLRQDVAEDDEQQTLRRFTTKCV